MLPADQKLVSLMDIGINLANPRFKQDLHAVLTRAKQSGVDDLMITGVSEESSRAAIKLCKQHNLRKGEELPRLRCTVGVHPHDAKDFDMSKTPAVLEELLADDVVAAVGECGLDFNRMYSPQDVQIAVFERQIEIAKKCSKPLFLHERDAHEAFVGILRKHRPTLRNNIVVHCFTGTLEQMKEYIALDCYIGFTGFICDEREGRGAHLKRVVQATPVDRIMIETDGKQSVRRVRIRTNLLHVFRTVHITEKLSQILDARQSLRTRTFGFCGAQTGRVPRYCCQHRRVCRVNAANHGEFDDVFWFDSFL
jgi:TatD DNase family protein